MLIGFVQDEGGKGPNSNDFLDIGVNAISELEVTD